MQNSFHPIEVKFKTALREDEEKLQPYLRDEKGARPWAIPGTARTGTQDWWSRKRKYHGNVSYDPENHQLMVKLRQEKVDKIADYIPLQKLDSGPEKGELLVLGWGSTFGSIKTAVSELQKEGLSISHAHLRYIRPFPKNLGQILKNFKQVLIPELNNGQLIKIVRDQYLVDAIGYNKIMGIPFTRHELKQKMREMVDDD